ncbi:hypothetical protein VHEMI06451 [[Torrubiella] hemipterigena]|nr:hypothetical protein VHEMI06451 [[Torrubiella] hemipterigena]
MVKDLQESAHSTRIIEWLKSPDPSTNLNAARELHQAGTGEWLLNNDVYKSWQATQGSFLWLHGIPGCGKTILSSTVITHLQQNEHASKGLLYFFFSFTDIEKQSSENAVRSLIHQLYRKREESRAILDSVFRACDNGGRQASQASLQEALYSMILQCGEVWIVLDALDECPARNTPIAHGLLPWIREMQTLLPAIHLLVTSRPEQDIRKSIETWAGINRSISLQSELIADDINAFIHAQVGRFDRWQNHRRVQLKIENELTKRADGMFRWVACQIDILKDCLMASDVEEALRTLPKSLDETYERILDRVRPEYKHHAIRLLQFLTYSERPLRLEEAVDLVAVQPTSCPAFDSTNRMPVPEEIALYCSTLVVLVYSTDRTTVELQLAHFSIKEYLQSERLDLKMASFFDKTTAATEIVSVCLSYLMTVDPTLSTSEIVQEYRFARFAAQFWSKFERIIEESTSAVFNLTKAYYACQAIFNMGYRIYPPDSPYQQVDGDEGEQGVVSSLYYTSLVGLLQSVRMLLSNGANANSQGGYYGHSLGAASENGHEVIIKTLLDHGADIDALVGRRGNALAAASSRGDEAMVRTLLDYGANVNAQGGKYGNALGAASYKGSEAVVRMLLDRGAQTNAHLGGVDGNPLYAAISNGSGTAVKSLLADVNSMSDIHGNALTTASILGHGTIAQILLDHGADPNAPGSMYGNALSAASSNGHEAIVQMLLDHGAEVNGYANALYAASSNGHKAIVQILLDHGADTNAQSSIYGSALLAASHVGDETIVQILLSHGADVNGRGGIFISALYTAAENGHTAIVDILLHAGANLTHIISYMNLLSDDLIEESTTGIISDDSSDEDSSEALIEVLTLLLSRGADPNKQDDFGRTPLFMAAGVTGDLDVLKMLLEHGALIDIRDYYECTPLMAAVRNGHADVVQFLLTRNDADINAVDVLGRSVSWWAARTANVQIIQSLHQCRLQIPEFTTSGNGDAVSTIVEKCREQCDVCLRGIPMEALYAHCNICQSGYFSICRDCSSHGLHCRDGSHRLALHDGSSICTTESSDDSDS